MIQPLRSEFRGHRVPVISLIFVNSDTILVSATGQTVRTWDVERGVAILVVEVGHIRHLVGSLYNPFVVIIRRGDENLLICDGERGNYAELPVSARAAAYRPGGQSLLIDNGDEIEGLQIYNLGSLMELWRPGSEGNGARASHQQGLAGTPVDSLRSVSLFLSLRCNTC